MGPHGTLVLVATVGVIGVSCAWVMSATSIAVRQPHRSRRLSTSNGLLPGSAYYASTGTSAREVSRAFREELPSGMVSGARALPATRTYALESATTAPPTWGVESWSRAIATYGALLQQATEQNEMVGDYSSEEAVTFDEVATSFGTNPLDWHSGETGAWPFAA